MFVRKKKNKSGTVSVQIISKESGKYKVAATIGCSNDPDEIEKLVVQANNKINQSSGQLKLLSVKSSSELAVEAFLETLSNSNIITLGPELIFGALFDKIGLGKIKDEMFRHLVIARLAYPTSKLGTIDYLYRYQGIKLSIDKLYRFLDKLSGKYQAQVEKIVFNHTKNNLKKRVQVVFYDLTTLYFETESEDDLRKTGFSKDGKFHHPQILIGLLTTMQGYPLGYELFKGNTFEGKTLIPAIKRLEEKFGLKKPVIVADSALLSKRNIKALKKAGYEYILGARIKNETKNLKKKILKLNLNCSRPTAVISKDKQTRLIVNYSGKRAKKDKHNRKRGLKRLEKKVKTGRLTKAHINNRGYNKYLQLKGKARIEIDYHKFKKDSSWDGLKGHITNTKLKPDTIISHYSSLWQIEKAFRISKTDLRIRPVFHYKKRRIKAHLSIVFAAYSIYKELERLLKKEKCQLSIKRAAKLTHNMYALKFTDLETKQEKQILLKMSKEQKLLYQIVYNSLG